MSEPNRPGSVPDTDRRPLLASALLFVGAAAVAAMLSTGAAARSQAAPSNVKLPTISGMAVVGETLTAVEGEWTGAPFTLTYGWRRCDAAGENCSTPIATGKTYVVVLDDLNSTLRVEETHTPDDVHGVRHGATVPAPADGGLADGSNCASISDAESSTYTLVAEDVGHRIRIRVTASNTLGSQTVASNASAAVQSSSTTTAQAPRNTRVPSISGTAAQGEILFASVGTWTGTTPLTYTYQWLRCEADGGGSTGAGCTAITGATIAQYTLTQTDLERRLRVQVTARNTSGTATAMSDPTALVQVAGSTPPPP